MAGSTRTQGSEERANLLDEQVRRLESGKVSTPGRFEPSLDVERALDALARRSADARRVQELAFGASLALTLARGPLEEEAARYLDPFAGRKDDGVVAALSFCLPFRTRANNMLEFRRRSRASILDQTSDAVSQPMSVPASRLRK